MQSYNILLIVANFSSNIFENSTFFTEIYIDIGHFLCILCAFSFYFLLFVHFLFTIFPNYEICYNKHYRGQYTELYIVVIFCHLFV